MILRHPLLAVRSVPSCNKLAHIYMLSFRSLEASTPRKSADRMSSPLTQRKPEHSQRPTTSELAYLAVSARQNRPRGIALGEFSKAHRGTFQISNSTPVMQKPGKRQFDRDLLSAHSPVPTGKRTTSKGPPANPIIQSDQRFTPSQLRPKATQDWRPSPLTEYTNDKRLLQPYERGMLKKDA